jgi:hypothetical protein
MRKTTGHIIRICGLLIEMLGIWGVFSATDAKGQARLQLPGGTVVPLAWLAVGLGFVLWLTGTVIVYAARSGRKPVQSEQRELVP